MASTDGCSAITVEAGSAITKFRFIVEASDGQYDHVATAQGHVDGISCETVSAAGKQLPMVVGDNKIAKVEAGATIAKGDLLASDNAGKAIVWVDAVGNKCWGRAREAAASGQIMELQFGLKTVGAGS